MDLLLHKILSIKTVEKFFGDLRPFEKTQDFPGGSEVKVSSCSTGDPGLIPESERSPGEGNGNPLQGWGCLVGYSPRGRKESDTTEQLRFHSDEPCCQKITKI